MRPAAGNHSGRAPTPPDASDTDGPKETHIRILHQVRQIPPGYVSTYGRVAEAAGHPGRARLVGHILARSPLAGDVPWHRVVGASGRVSERRGGTGEQLRLLAAEGLESDAVGRIDLSLHLWRF